MTDVAAGRQHKSFSAAFEQRLWNGRAGGSHALSPIAPRDSSTPTPIAFPQRPMWYADALDPGTPIYHVYDAFRLRGRVDVRVLQDAFDEIVRRHEALRTAFRVVAGEPVQIVLPPRAFPLEVEDRPEIGDDAERLRAASEPFVRRPFALADGDTARALLLRVAHDDAYLVLCLHHIVRDGSSMGILFDELSALSAAARRADALAPLPIQYGDYALWQRQLDASGAFDAQRAYWRGRLDGAPFVLDLPSDRPRTGRSCAAGGVRTLEVEPRVADALRAIAREADASFFMTTAAAFQTFVHRYTGASDVLTGFPVAGRVRPETERLIGCFINTVVLRTQFERGLGFRDVLARVRDDAIAAYGNQDVPFEHLVEDLHPERREGMNPIVQTLISRVDRRRPTLRLPGVHVDRVDLRIALPKVDASLEIIDRAHALTCRLEYGEIFTSATADRMLEHFGTLLRSIAHDPEANVDALAMLSASERDLLVHGWNPRPARGGERCVHALFETWAARTPDAPAVAHGSQVLTYADLDGRATALAHRLRAAGAGAGCLVGVYLDRSPAFIVAVLATLKAGAAYVPLDPYAPSSRIALIVADARVAVVVTDAGRRDGEGLGGATVVVVDDAAATPQPGLPHVTPSDLAYVIYTSGTTGRPKGVMAEHRSVVAYLETAIATFSLGPGDRILQFSATTFDMSVPEIWGALCSGATVVLRDDEMLASPAAFARACAAWTITVLVLPTAYWHELANAVGSREVVLPPSVRMALVGGESMSTAHAVRWKQAVGERSALYNHYGPTETTVAVTQYEVPAAERIDATAAIPIGRPYPHARCYVLDALLQPAPVNVPGDLYIGGAGVARGYLGDPALTAARFVRDPYADDGATMYRTGDRARVLPGGAIEFLGRADRQVKLRGFRIELGEIESVLSRHPDVREAVVEAVDGDDGVRRLVAFVATSADSDALREFLARELPAYMVPAAFVVVDALPRTPHMKVDRASLRALAPAKPPRERPYVPPVSPVECALAEIACDVLGVERVGLDDDFFALGGRSLQGATLIARVNERFRIALTLRRYFEAPTLAALGRAVVDAMESAAPDAHAAAIVRRARDGRAPATFAQRRLWFLDRLTPDAALYHVSRAFRLRGAIDVHALGAAIRALVDRHDVLRTRLIDVDGEPVQVIGPPESVALTVCAVDAPDAEAAHADALAIATREARRPFDLSAEPPLRPLLVRLGADDHLLALIAHHGALDGLSLATIVRDLSALYAAVRHSRALDAPPARITYADYAAWEAERLASGAFDAELAYWRARLDGASAAAFPADRPRPERQPVRGSVHEQPVSADVADAVGAFAREHGTTPFVVLLAAFAAHVRRTMAHDRLVVAIPESGRSRSDVQHVVGMFVNTLPIVLDVSMQTRFADLVEQTRVRVLEAIDHGIPFDLLVGRLAPRRHANRSPFADTMFTQRADFAVDLDLDGVVASPVPLDPPRAKFDLTVEVIEEGGVARCVWTFADEVYANGTIRRLAAEYLDVVAAGVAQPGRSVAALPVASHARGVPATPAVPSSGQQSIAPRDELERALVHVWEELLEPRPIGVTDNFFELGGHSLLAARMTARIEERTARHLPVAALFSAQTIEEIAAVLRADAHDPRHVVLRLRAGDARPPFFLLHGDLESEGLYCARVADGLGDDQPFFVVAPHGYGDERDVPSVETMARERLRAIREHHGAAPYVLGGYCINGAVALEIARLVQTAGEDVPLVVLIDAPFGLPNRPLLRGATRAAARIARWSTAREHSAYVRWHRRWSYFARLRPGQRAAWIANAPTRARDRGEPSDPLEQRYVESIGRYRARAYSGRVLMINSVTDAARTDWSHLAPNAVVRTFSTDHRSLVREHGVEIGRLIRREIDALMRARERA